MAGASRAGPTHCPPPPAVHWPRTTRLRRDRQPLTPRFYVNSWAARTGQRIAGRVIDSLVAFGCFTLVIVIGPHGRPLAQDVIIILGVTGIEAFSIARTRATIGMRVAGIRVATLGRTGPPDLLTAWRRSLPVALCYPLLMPMTPVAFVMPGALLISIWMSPQRRAFHDRLSNSVVVQAAAPETISAADLATWWQPDQAIVMSPWGRIPDVFERRRARAHRLDGAWWLAGLIMCITIISAGVRDVPLLWVWTTLGWLVIAVADETWWISTRGATPGHRVQGYRVVDIATGRTPSRGRALARAIIVVPMVCIPPLQILAALWVHASSLHRGPHDLIAHTIVVEPDYESVAFLPAPPVLYPSPVAFGYRPPPPPVRGPF